MSGRWVLAIDFGTTYTAGAVADGDSVELVEIDGSPRLPSVVLLSEAGELVVGQAAERQMAMVPDRIERTPKRRLGDEVMLLGGVPVRPVEAVAAVLARVAAEARRRRGGEAPGEVRLTHPARWAESRREALLEAARLAGLGQPVLIPEPVAAAVMFADERITPGCHVAVYDLGGGTFDTAVLRRSQTGFEVVGSPGGDERLGGEDFDERLYRHIGERLADEAPAVWDALQSSPERPWRKANADLRAETRQAKEALSANADYCFYLGAPVDREVRVTRDELEALIRPDIEATVEELSATVARAGLSPGELAAVNLVGGSSRIPLVGRLVAERFGRVPATWGDPKAAVTLGAARALAVAAAPAEELGGGQDGDAPLPTAIGEYEVLAQLGRGGMGRVLLGRQRSLDRLVAIKTLPGLGEAEAAQLRREATVLSELQHPHIATILDVGLQDGSPYVVMPFFAGGTLAQAAGAGPLKPGQVAAVLAAVAEALDATHRRGFLHRDVKPTNVLLSEQGEPYLADFGLAFAMGGSGGRSTGIVGTVGYLAPELAENAPPTPAVDTYSLGVCGYELLTGKPPYAGDNPLAVLDAARRARPTPLAEAAPAAPPALVTLVESAMAASPSDRPLDLRSFAAALRAAAPSEPIAPNPPRQWSEAVAFRARAPRSARTPNPPRRRSLVGAIAGAVVLALIVTAVVVTRDTQPASAELALETQALTTGIRVERAWSLKGKQGQKFEARLTFRNPTDAQAKETYVLTVPKTLAGHESAVKWVGERPPNLIVVNPDPVFSFDVDLAPSASLSVGYEIDVPATGAKVSRLHDWAAAVEAVKKDTPDPELAGAGEAPVPTPPAPTEAEIPVPPVGGAPQQGTTTKGPTGAGGAGKLTPVGGGGSVDSGAGGTATESGRGGTETETETIGSTTSTASTTTTAPPPENKPPVATGEHFNLTYSGHFRCSNGRCWVDLDVFANDFDPPPTTGWSHSSHTKATHGDVFYGSNMGDGETTCDHVTYCMVYWSHHSVEQFGGPWSDQFTYTISDDEGLLSTATVTLNVTY